MKIVRYGANEAPAWGVVEGETVFALNGSPFGDWEKGDEVGPLAETPLLAPTTPSKIICIGRNYAEHAAELGNEVPSEPLIFFKPPSSIIGPEAAIKLTSLSQHIDHEAELVLVIGKQCRNVSEADAMSVIFGYTCGNDVSARDLQRRDGQWARAKGFDTFCPLGPWIVTADEFDPSAVAVRCIVNGEVRQKGNSSDLIFGLPRLIHDVTAVMTLEPGDIIMTGTPSGVSPIKGGDVIEVEIEGVGTLRNPVEGA